MALDQKGNKEKQRNADGGGYTIIELLITMVLIAIVALIAVPSFQRIAVNNNLKTAARDMASDFALYKERAIAENCMYRIVLNVGGGTYDIQQCGATGSVCGGYNSIQVKNLIQYANDISFGAGGTTVTSYFFQTRGTVTNGTIVLRNGRNSAGTITINITGRTNVQFNLQ
jgi:prepilin-type N-terminal cleavage/methylation domain-containing protein